MNGIIRENILFYSNFEYERYTKDLNDYQLNKDF